MCIQAPVAAAPSGRSWAAELLGWGASKRSTTFHVDALPDGNVYNTFKPNTKPWTHTSPFDIENEDADVVISYSTRMLGHRNEATQPEELWILVNALHKQGIKAFAAPMTPAGGKWDDEFYGNLDTAKAMLAMWSPEYWQPSPVTGKSKCIEEFTTGATRYEKTIFPLLFSKDAHMAPENYGLGGDKPARKLAANMKRRIGQTLPQPGNRFQDDWEGNVAKLCAEIKKLPSRSA